LVCKKGEGRGRWGSEYALENYRGAKKGKKLTPTRGDNARRTVNYASAGEGKGWVGGGDEKATECMH